MEDDRFLTWAFVVGVVMLVAMLITAVNEVQSLAHQRELLRSQMALLEDATECVTRSQRHYYYEGRCYRLR